jgi:acyl-CoA thioester hydrolase
MKTITSITPRYVETDKMGIIHHSVYPVWYEVGRVDFCREMGMPFDKIEERKLYLAVVELTSVYKASSRFGDELKLITTLKSYTKVKMEFTYEIYNQNGILINTGRSVHAWLNDQYRPINIAKDHGDLYELIVKSGEQA